MLFSKINWTKTLFFFLPLILMKYAFGESLDFGELRGKYASWAIHPSNSDSNINLRRAWKKFKKKREIVVAVVDTGIDPKHPYLRKNIWVPNGRASTKNFGLDFSRGKKYRKEPTDSHGHGTHIAGIIRSVYPEVKILTLKYYNPRASGQANLDATIKALEYAVNSKAHIINYSGGGPEESREEKRILRKAEKKGILVVAASGNENSDIDGRGTGFYPASYGFSNILTVTAYNKRVQILPSSNWGQKSVHIAAPGNRIKSALQYGRAGYLTGTSQATAFVSGVAALLMANNPRLTTQEVKKIIFKSAKLERRRLLKEVSGRKGRSYSSIYSTGSSRKKRFKIPCCIKQKRLDTYNALVNSR